MKKEALTNKSTKPKARNKQRGVGVVELLVATAASGTTVLVTAMHGPKLPPLTGD